MVYTYQNYPNSAAYSITISTSSTPSAPEISVSGSGNNISDGDFTPSSSDGTDFGSVTVGGGAIQRTFTVFNSGNATLNISNFILPSGFSIVDSLSSSIVAGSSDSFTVQLNTASTGTPAGDISFNTNDSDENPFNFRIAGTVNPAQTAPEISVSGGGFNIADGDTTPSSSDGTDFGSVTAGGSAIQRTFTVANSGNATLNISNFILPSGFSIVETLSSSISSGGSDSFTVQLNTANTGTPAGDISFNTNDSDENPFNFRIAGTVNAPNQRPSLGVAGSATYTELASPVKLSPTVTLSDDGTTLSSATVRISIGAFANDQDFLGVTTSGTNITPSYNTATETLTLTGVDTIARYQQVLASVTFQSPNHNLTNFGANTTRLVEWTVSDGSLSSTTQFSTVSITAVNEAPVASPASYSVRANGSLGVLADLLANVTDVDSARSALLVALASGPSHGTLSSFRTDGSFTYTPFANYVGADSFTYIASDGALISAAATVSIAITGADHDFNADLRSDILLQNVKTGGAYIWQMNGTGLVGNGPVGWTPGAAWQAKDTGDYNGDGRADVLLQNANTGDCYLWLVNGTSLVGNGPVGWTTGAAWQANDGGDFNGDGRDDILLQNANTGACFIWELNGTSLVGNGGVGWTPGAAWQAKATGDFNGDGKSDIVLQNVNTGDVYIWELNGTNLVGNGAVGWTPGAAWQVKAAADYNGDGKSDILLQNANTGACYIWELNGTSLVAHGAAGWTPGAAWQAKDGGDFNGDGKSDILLQNVNTGDAYMWLMNGTSLAGHGPAGWTPGADWHIL